MGLLLSMGNHTQLHSIGSDGQQLSLQHTSTDSPILPAANLEHLQRIDPNLVDFVVEQTQKEAEFRRSENKRTNTFIFLERISGVLLGAAVAIVGIVTSGFLVLNGHDWAGIALGGGTLATIVSVIVTKTNQANINTSSKPPVRKPRNRRN
jgi:hypothetical protein